MDPVLLASNAPLGSPYGKLLVAIVVLAVVVFVGRVVLAVAWRLLLIAALVIGALYVLSFLPF